MMRSPAQSDFVVTRPQNRRQQPMLRVIATDPQELPAVPRPVQFDELPPAAQLIALPEPRVDLPEARLRSSEASAFATRWVMRAAFVLLLALFALLAIGPHIPSGE
jgi:hypothetical protein